MVLRRWLRGVTESPVSEFERAMARATEPLRGAEGRAYAVTAADGDLAARATAALTALDALLPDLRRLSGGPQ